MKYTIIAAALCLAGCSSAPKKPPPEPEKKVESIITYNFYSIGAGGGDKQKEEWQYYGVWINENDFRRLANSGVLQRLEKSAKVLPDGSKEYTANGVKMVVRKNGSSAMFYRTAPITGKEAVRLLVDSTK